MIRLTIPRKAAQILRRLTDAGYEACVVGGCVRDSLLGRTPGDWDITTSALPSEVKAVFPRTIDTGIEHGTVTVRLGGESFEVTTFRVDGKYSDSRHPDSVSFTPSLSEDLRRRDFTVNAMAYHPEKGLVDLFGGLDDLKNGIIRAVGDPYERFDEDALRILRAVRFAAQLGFTIEPETLKAVSHFAPRLSLVSRERIQTELTKLLVSDHPDRFRLLYETGITAAHFPLFDQMMALPQNSPFHCLSVGEHTLAVLCAAEPDSILRLTALLHDTGKVAAHTVDETGRDHFKGHNLISTEIAERFLKELRYDNRTVDLVTKLCRIHDDRFPPTPAGVRKAIHRYGEELFSYYLRFIRVDNLAKSEFAKAEFGPRYEALLTAEEEVRKADDCLSLKDLAVTGSDLKAAGLKPGPAMGRTLNAMLEEVLERPEHNTKDYLMGNLAQFSQ